MLLEDTYLMTYVRLANNKSFLSHEPPLPSRYFLLLIKLRVNYCLCHVFVETVHFGRISVSFSNWKFRSRNVTNRVLRADNIHIHTRFILLCNRVNAM
jgi:hypothetical protein